MTAVEYIQHWEGFRPRLYLCPAGYPTIGYGTRVATWNRYSDEFSGITGDLAWERMVAQIKADTGDWITREQATALMLPAVGRAESVAVKAFGVYPMVESMEPGEERVSARGIALIDIAYNMGGFSKFPRFVEAVKAGDWQLAHDELLYVGGGLHVVPGKYMTKTAYYHQTGRRAECNARVLLTGIMPDPLP